MEAMAFASKFTIAKLWEDAETGVIVLGAGATIIALGNFVSMIITFANNKPDWTIFSFLLSATGLVLWVLTLEPFINAKEIPEFFAAANIWSISSICMIFAGMLSSMVIGFIPDPNVVVIEETNVNDDTNELAELESVELAYGSSRNTSSSLSTWSFIFNSLNVLTWFRNVRTPPYWQPKTKTTDKLGNTTTVQYDRYGNKTTTYKDTKGNKEVTTVDSRGRQTK